MAERLKSVCGVNIITSGKKPVGGSVASGAKNSVVNDSSYYFHLMEGLLMDSKMQSANVDVLPRNYRSNGGSVKRVMNGKHRKRLHEVEDMPMPSVVRLTAFVFYYFHW